MILPEKLEVLPPYDDYILKAMLTRPTAKPALMDLISASINRKVLSVDLRNNELPVEDINEKNQRFDINCVIDGGDQIDVETQRVEVGGNNRWASELY